MKINDILNESSDQHLNQAVKDISSIDAGIEHLLHTLKSNPKAFSNIDPEEFENVELEEGIAGTLGKSAVIGSMGLASLFANAGMSNNELGETFATCAGVFALTSAMQASNNDASAARAYGNLSVRSLQLAQQFIPARQADIIGNNVLQDYKNKLQRNVPGTGTELVRLMSFCKTSIDKVNSIDQQNKASQQQNTQQSTQKSKTEVGTLNLPNGAVYKGEHSDGVPNGKGFLKRPGGITVDGTFVNGKYVQGTYNFGDGGTFVGSFKNEYPYNGQFNDRDGKVRKMINGNFVK